MAYHLPQSSLYAGKFHRANPGDPRYEGVYYRLSKRGKVFYIHYRTAKKKQVFEKIGHEQDGFTPAQALHIRHDRVRNSRLGILLPKDYNPTTVDDLYNMYMENARVDGLNLRSEASRYRNHIQPHIGKFRIDLIDFEKAIDLKSKWETTNLSTGTRRAIQFFCIRLWQFAINHEIWEGRNPFQKLSKPLDSPKRERFLTHEQAHMVLNKLKQVYTKTGKLVDLKTYQAAALSLFTGLRKSEIQRLTKHNLIENGTQFLVKTKHKRRNINRSVVIPPICKPIVDSIPWEEGVTYFGTSRDMAKYSERFTRAVNKLGLNAGAKTITDRITFHSLRHTYGSWLAQGATPIHLIKDLMGHSDISTTEKYLHLIPDYRHQAVLNLGERFEQAIQETKLEVIKGGVK